MTKIVNLTQHNPMPAQIEAGVASLPEDQIPGLKELLTFKGSPTHAEMAERAEKVAALAKASGADKAMIGGAAYSMPALEQALQDQGITPTYAFTSIKMEQGPDGNNKRVIEHKGFVDAPERQTANSGVPSLDALAGSKILNLTKFPVSPEQREGGVAEPSDKNSINALVNITSDTPPTPDELKQRATDLANIAAKELENESNKFALIGGLPLYMVGAVEAALEDQGIKPVHSFTERKAVEKTVDGKTEKSFVFEHTGFVESRDSGNQLNIDPSQADLASQSAGAERAEGKDKQVS